ncbi:class I adenylate-forming enzyme family protein [Streptomyces sp. 3MP-14]|uniref:class I adenylate-forming enzyme family protein n=1 Tax=Streptomyces sp. 3MP-14 TaxID=2586636 RepID=UPI001D03A59E|nr:class I adenylate-forming enzyme family protein [Streptomyces sp. 3MP-14]
MATAASPLAAPPAASVPVPPPAAAALAPSAHAASGAAAPSAASGAPPAATPTPPAAAATPTPAGARAGGRARPWASRAGLAIPDLVPAVERRAWVARGLCPDRDLHALFRERVAAHPRRQAVVEADDPPGGGWDYATLDAEVRRIAALFAEAGLGAGDVVALRMPNGRRAVAAELAVYAIGAVALPYPPGGGRRDTLALLGRSRARGAVFAEETDLALAGQLPQLRAVFTTEAARADPAGGVRWLDAPARTPWVPARVDPAAPARLMVSSGSEAEPKMVAYSHHAMGGGRVNYLRALTPGDAPRRHLVLVPFGSSFGSCGVLTVAALGGTLLLQPAFDPAGALRALATHRPTHLFGVPTMLRRIAEAAPERTPEPEPEPEPEPAPGAEEPSPLAAVVSSGAELPPTTARLAARRLGAPVITVYGSSDGVNCHTRVAPDAPAGLVGVPDPAVVSLRVVGPDQRPLPPGESGEIQAKGPMTPLCYVGDPALDEAHRTPDGWVRTGDLGRLDAEGRLFLLGRLRNVVIRGGLNISPAEVERALAAHPAVAEAACVPVPDPELGERLCACVRAAPGAEPPSLAALNAFLLTDVGLEKRKLPEFLLELADMPRGPTGKVCRRTLTRRAAARHGRR